MEQLWSPWRKAYVTQPAAATAGCVFCEALEKQEDEGNLIVHRGAFCFVLMNLYPYNAGHLMIAPLAHVATLGEMDRETLGEMMELVRLSERVLEERYHPNGFNVGMNLGRVSGAGVPGHIHMHVVPRWEGDTNFMTVLSGVRVISEDLREAARELRARFRGRDSF